MSLNCKLSILHLRLKNAKFFVQTYTYTEYTTWRALFPGTFAPVLTLKPGLAHFRWLEYRGVLIAQQEIAPEAKKTFHLRLLMSLNSESEQDP
jgi:hypothetical protein